MIRFSCLSCGRQLSAPEGCEGRASRCGCGQPVSVPGPSDAQIESDLGRLVVTPGFCEARGRYELAGTINWLQTVSYFVRVVLDPSLPVEAKPNVISAMKDREKSHAKYASLIQLRGEILEAVARRPDGVEMNDLRLECVGISGIVCNQLDRGGWLAQDNSGRRRILRRSLGPVKTDTEFGRSEIEFFDAIVRLASLPKSRVVEVSLLAAKRQHREKQEALKAIGVRF